MKQISDYVIILCGGTGSRLWPWSTEKCPKPCMPFHADGTTLLQQTAKRALSLVPAENIWIVTHQAQGLLVKKQVEAIEASLGKRIIEEHLARNTLPATAAALKQMPQAGTVTILPSDHLIQNHTVFKEDWMHAVALAKSSKLVLFGIPPRSPSTDFGYIEINTKGNVIAFHEKPPLETATTYMKQGFMWNSGIVVADLELLQLEIGKKGPIEALKPESLDHGLLEKSKVTDAIRARFDWSDLGTWENLFEAMPKEKDQNVLKGRIECLESKENLVWAKSLAVTLVGVEHLVVVQNGNEILVAKRSSLNPDALKKLSQQASQKDEVIA